MAAVGVFWDVSCSPFLPPGALVEALRRKFGPAAHIRAYAVGAVQSQLQLRSDLAQLGISLTNYSKGGMAEQVNLERIITADVCAFAMDASAPSSIVLIASTPSAYLYLASLLQQRNFSITLVVDPHMYQQSLGRVSRVMTWEHVQSSPMWGQAENGTAHAGNGQRVVSPYRPAGPIIYATPSSTPALVHSPVAQLRNPSPPLAAFDDSAPVVDDLPETLDADYDFWATKSPLRESPSLPHLSDTFEPKFRDSFDPDPAPIYTSPSTSGSPTSHRESPQLGGDPIEQLSASFSASVALPPESSPTPVLPAIGGSLDRMGGPSETPSGSVGRAGAPLPTYAGALTPRRGQPLRGTVSASGAYAPTPPRRLVARNPVLPRSASSSTTSTSSTATFRPLVNLLRRKAREGDTHPLRSSIGSDLKKGWAEIYSNQGPGIMDFKSYVGAAQREGLILLGGTDGAEWITLV